MADTAMKYSGANAIITGGLGCIGSSLVRRLVHQGPNVTLVDNRIFKPRRKLLGVEI